MDSKVFWSVDFLSGYFQSPISPESRRLTAFLTTFRKFNYRRLPKGYSESGDQFGLHTDPIARVPRVIKSVDGILGQCLSMQDFYNSLAVVLTRVIPKGMV